MSVDDLSRGGIYRIVNLLNGKEYIGSTRCFEVRWRIHKRDLKANEHHSPHLQRAYNRYGANAFHYEVLEYLDDMTQLVVREQQYMDVRKPDYNARPKAANNLGVKQSAETRKRSSLAHMGLRHTPETRAKMSKTRTGMRRSLMARLSMSAAALKRYEDPAEREKTSASQRGKTISPEHLARLLEAKAAWLATPESHEILRQNAIKQFRDPEMRYKAGNGSRGRKQTPGEIAKRVESAKITMATPEYKAKASAARKGQKRTQETKTRMSVSQRKRLENPELRARVAENTRQQWARAKAEGKTTLGQQADQGQLRLFD